WNAHGACSGRPEIPWPVLDDLTDDSLLGGAVRFSQPAHGYRVAIDPILLQAAVPAGDGERVLDAGAGTGAASLCLATRRPSCRIVGLEVQRSLHRIAVHNVTQNGLAGRVEMIAGDLERLPPRLSGASFDHVMSNPPHLVEAAATGSPVAERARAHHEGSLDLQGWLSACVRMLRPGGRLTLIHRPDRLGEIVACLAGRLGDLVVFPLWPAGERRAAKRVLIQGRKGSRGSLRLMRGLILHDADGRYSPVAECVLRHGKALDLSEDWTDGAHRD
ncbi:MAG: tRNA1(Val) (adenine(37)-N6)-methyltransferase, partial [Geminicoccaceae bacterium]